MTVAGKVGNRSGLKAKSISRSGSNVANWAAGSAGFNGSSRAPHCNSAK